MRSLASVRIGPFCFVNIRATEVSDMGSCQSGCGKILVSTAWRAWELDSRVSEWLNMFSPRCVLAFDYKEETMES